MIEVRLATSFGLSPRPGPTVVHRTGTSIVLLRLKVPFLFVDRFIHEGSHC